MFDELNQKLIEISESVRERNRFRNLLDESEKTLALELRKLNENDRILKKEKADVDRLENTSLTNMFHSILGNKETQLDKEKQDFIAAKLKYDRCKSTVKSLKRDISFYKEELSAFEDVDEKYSSLLTEKEKAIANDKGESFKKLLKNTESTAEANSMQKELSEAISAGEDVIHELIHVIDSLKSASNWGTFDMLGGGLIATAVKHNKMDNAKEHTHQVQNLLHRFNRELKDVDLNTGGVEIDISSFLTFADYFIDNLITDWVVQSRIGDSLTRARELNVKIGIIMGSLEKRIKDQTKRKESLQEERKDLISNAK